MKSLLRKFKKFAKLPLSVKWLVFRAFLVTGLICMGLRLMNFARFRGLYSRMLASGNRQDFTEEYIGRLSESIRRVSPVFSAMCLPQALALKYFIRSDKSAELIIGVKKDKDFEAHAWVEKSGRILIGDLPENDFKAIWKWN